MGIGGLQIYGAVNFLPERRKRSAEQPEISYFSFRKLPESNEFKLNYGSATKSFFVNICLHLSLEAGH